VHLQTNGSHYLQNLTSGACMVSRIALAARRMHRSYTLIYKEKKNQTKNKQTKERIASMSMFC
jgi:hypothetical protein